MRLLERAGYAGPRHFDAHAYRNEDADGRLGLRARAACARTSRWPSGRAHFDALPEVQEALAAASAPELGEASTSGAGEADALKAEADGLDALASAATPTRRSTSCWSRSCSALRYPRRKLGDDAAGPANTRRSAAAAAPRTAASPPSSERTTPGGSHAAASTRSFSSRSKPGASQVASVAR